MGPQPSPNHTPERRDFRKEVTDSIIKMLEEGVAPWQKPWDASTVGNLAVPFNPTSDRAYRGGNAIHLMATAIRKGYDDSRWMTYKQAADNGWQVQKGQKGTQIEFWELKQAANDEGRTSPSDSEEVSQNGTQRRSESRFIHRVYTVFNAKQIDGVPSHEPKHHTVFEAVETGEQILSNSGARISLDQADRAYYSRASDSIHLPPRQSFHDAPGFYGTALHELAHWTGHPDRLNRPTLNDTYRFGDQNYAREELRAELASVFLAAERGIPHDPGKHASYVASWIKALRDDKNEIFRAAQDASRATEFLLSLERDKSIGEAVLLSPDASVGELEEVAARIQSDLETEPRDARLPLNQALPSAVEKSLFAAEKLAERQLGSSARMSVAVTDGGIYRGAVIGETEYHVIQQTSKNSAVAHPKELFDSPPQAGQKVSITYADSQATVREIRERARTPALER